MTDKKMPKIMLGTWSWGAGAAGGDQVFGNSLGADDLRPVFDAAIDAGLNMWDTATVYGMGSSEGILAGFVKGVPRVDVIISTKFTPQIAGDAANPVEAMCDASLALFDTDYLDLYWIHNPQDVEKWTPLIASLVKKGKVRRIGVSNHSLSELKRAQEILGAEGVEISAVQNHYSLLYRSSERGGILDYCHENGIDFFAYMTLEQGALSGKYDTEHPLPAGSQRGDTYNPLLPQIESLTSVMGEIAEKHGATIPQVAVAWAIAKGTTPIVGVTKVGQVDDAAKSAELALTEEDMAMLEDAAAKVDVDTRGGWEHPMD